MAPNRRALSADELAWILAGLRFIQRTTEASGQFPAGLDDYFAEVQTDVDIDQLCEDINCSTEVRLIT